MAAAATLPPVPQPPHDPKFLLLDARVGWRAMKLDQVAINPATASLELAPLPGVLPEMTDESGSFGGLTLPSNVAMGGDGSIYLLDRASLRLKRFDPCCCRFDVVPCFGGSGKGARNLSEPGGIAICAGDLYVCDSGNARVLVLSLRGLLLRAIWMLPAAAQMPNPWRPVDIAPDGRGHLHVADPNNGAIHRFHPSGRYLSSQTGFGVARHVVFDCSDNMYVHVEGEPVVRAVNASPDLFPALPFPLDRKGNLNLGGLCTPPASAIFDLSGALMPLQPVNGPLQFTSGTYISAALDSRTYRCEWHRIVLSGSMPSGSRVIVSTFTAEAEAPESHIDLLPESAWDKHRAGSLPGGEWDCLIGSKGGRYLWLRLEIRGDGFSSPSLSSVRLEFPRISLRRYLPAVFGEEPSGASFTDRFLSIFDTTIRSIETQVDNQSRLYDPMSAPAEKDADFLTWLGSWLGISLERHWPEQRRRHWLKNAPKNFCMRGTLTGLHRQLILFLGFDYVGECCPVVECCPKVPLCPPGPKAKPAFEAPPLILEHFKLRRWLFVGAGRLGDQAKLWGESIVGRSQLDANAQIGVTRMHGIQDAYRDPFHHYAHKFTVFVPACYGKSPQARRSLINLLESEKPAHTQPAIEYVSPRMRIGVQASVGLNTVVGRYPEHVLLGGARLGGDSVLPESPAGGAPAFRTGASRIGSSTRLQ